MMIPYICPELPEAQKEALHYLVKTPLVYTTVALNNWRAFQRLGVSSVTCPGGYHTGFSLNHAQHIGGYRSHGTPDEPILIHMTRTPARSEEHTSELQYLMRISYAVFCLKKKKNETTKTQPRSQHETRRRR